MIGDYLLAMIGLVALAHVLFGMFPLTRRHDTCNICGEQYTELALDCRCTRR